MGFLEQFPPGPTYHFHKFLSSLAQPDQALTHLRSAASEKDPIGMLFSALAHLGAFGPPSEARLQQALLECAKVRVPYSGQILRSTFNDHRILPCPEQASIESAIEAGMISGASIAYNNAMPRLLEKTSYPWDNIVRSAQGGYPPGQVLTGIFYLLKIPGIEMSLKNTVPDDTKRLEKSLKEAAYFFQRAKQHDAPLAAELSDRLATFMDRPDISLASILGMNQMGLPGYIPPPA